MIFNHLLNCIKNNPSQEQEKYLNYELKPIQSVMTTDLNSGHSKKSSTIFGGASTKLSCN